MLRILYPQNIRVIDQNMINYYFLNKPILGTGPGRPENLAAKAVPKLMLEFQT